MQQIGDAILGSASSRNTLASNDVNMPYNLEGMGKNVKRIGLVFSKEIHGVYITDPLDTSHATIFINPFDASIENPDEYASLNWHTIKHELIHDVVKGHTESFTSAEARVSSVLGKMEIKALTKLRGVYADPVEDGAVREDLDRPLQIYQDSRRRGETTPDIFGGEESRAEVAGPGGKERGGERVRPGGKGVVPEPKPDSVDAAKQPAETPAAPDKPPENTVYYNAERRVGDIKEGPSLGTYLTTDERVASHYANFEGKIRDYKLNVKDPLRIVPEGDDQMSDYFTRDALNEQLKKAGVKWTIPEEMDDDQFWRYLDDGGKKLVNAIRKAGFDADLKGFTGLPEVRHNPGLRQIKLN